MGEIEALANILSKMKRIAEEEYNGDISGSILPIFGRLTIQEKRMFLISNLTKYYLNSNDYTRHQEEQDETELDTLNRSEQIKLKHWLVKVVAAAILAYFLFYGDQLDSGGLFGKGIAYLLK